MKLEVVVIPVSDVDRAKRFYQGLGWREDVDIAGPHGYRAVHLTFASATDLASALRRAATAHGEHEKRTGQHDADWPDWYAAYLAADQSGDPLPS